MSSEHMTVQREARIKNRLDQRRRDPRETLFYLFLVAQICAIFAMVVGVLFFVLRIIKAL